MTFASTPESAAPGRLRHHPWMLLSLLPLGFGTWVPIVAGLRSRRPLWTWIGVGLTAVLLAGCVLAVVLPEDHSLGTFAGLLLIAAWVGAPAVTIAIYPAYRRRRVLVEGIEDLEQRSEADELREAHVRREREERLARVARERERARELVAQDRHAALERGIGRPDLPGADHGHVVDVNHAPQAVLTTLPGIDDDLARRIVATRETVGPFESVADVGFLLDLAPDTIERLERVAVAI